MDRFNASHVEGGGCKMPAQTRIGVYREALREALVEEDSWGQRVVVGEGDVRTRTYSLWLVNA